ncbi:MAG: hypothetical protein E7402_00605 [Ruminococcaceae bacterium]|nr:hypothetical protein [Oscillospiraceae bacterium]
MFGYVNIDKDELKVKDYNLFKAYYCGVCQALKTEYGFPARYFLSYEASFLAVLLSAVSSDAPCCCTIRCLANPLRKRPSMEQDACLSYAAAANVLLVWFKLLDDWQDTHSLRSLFLMPLMRRKMKRAKKRYPALYDGMAEHLAALSVLEKKGVREPDAPAAAFGRLMEVIFDVPLLKEGETRRVLRHCGSLLGRFIYLLDAWEDRADDKKKGAYNPYLAAETVDEAAEKLSLEYTLSELSHTMDLITPVRNKDILDNVIYLGLRNALDKAFADRSKTPCRQEKENRHERPL